MFGKCFLHRPIYSKTAVNVLPNTVLLKCSNCDTEHRVGQPCPAVWRGRFNLKDLGTALGHRTRNCTTEREAEDFSSSHLKHSKVYSIQSLHTLLFQYVFWLLPLLISMKLPGLPPDRWSKYWITKTLLCSLCCAYVGNYWGALPHTMFVLCSCSKFRCLTSVLISRLMSLSKELKQPLTKLSLFPSAGGESSGSSARIWLGSWIQATGRMCSQQGQIHSKISW